MKKTGLYYTYEVKGNICEIYKNLSQEYLGSVKLDSSNAWTPFYQPDTKYLPINSALCLLGYETCNGWGYE